MEITRDEFEQYIGKNISEIKNAWISGYYAVANSDGKIVAFASSDSIEANNTGLKTCVVEDMLRNGELEFDEWAECYRI